jgi:tol-pal system protein YbgF
VIAPSSPRTEPGNLGIGKKPSAAFQPHFGRTGRGYGNFPAAHEQDVRPNMTFAKSSAVTRVLTGVGAAVVLMASVNAGESANWPFGQQQQQQAPATQSDQAARLDGLESQLRTLTGQVEELQHQIQVLQDQLKRTQDDNEFRFGQLEKGGAKTPPAKPAPAAQAAQSAPPLPNPAAPAAANPPVAAPQPQNDAIAQQLGSPPQILGTLPAQGSAPAQPGGEQPLDLSSLAGDNSDAGAPAPGTQLPPPQQQDAQSAPQPPVQQPAPALAPAPSGNQQVASIAPTGNPRSDYDQAYNLINSGQYALAEKAFRQFLATYPTDEQAPDAQYWLGEALYDHGDYAGAAQEFKTGYTKYPNSKRAPDTLLKLGLSLAGLGYRDEACKMYGLLQKKYPQMSNGLKSRLKAEQASAAC